MASKYTRWDVLVELQARVLSAGDYEDTRRRGSSLSPTTTPPRKPLRTQQKHVMSTSVMLSITLPMGAR